MSVEAAETPEPLSRVYAEFERISAEVRAVGRQRELTAADLAPVEAFVDVKAFQRTGLNCEVQTWPEYAKFLAMRIGGEAKYESSLIHRAETDRMLFLEVAERVTRDDGVIVRNVMHVFEFDDQRRICALRVYQQLAK